jgi:hypothetical protein
MATAYVGGAKTILDTGEPEVSTARYKITAQLQQMRRYKITAFRKTLCSLELSRHSPLVRYKMTSQRFAEN